MALSIQGTPAAAAATSITLPAHAAGDLIVLVAYRDGNTAVPTKPAAAGTVPTWNTIDGPTGANTNAMIACWALATANNHTSGTWTNATGLFAIVYRGQNPGSPIGGHAQGGGSGANTCLAPAITLSKTDGTSGIVHVGGTRNVTAWGALSAGYTNRANVATEIRGATKDTTTSDGQISMVPTNVNSGSGYRAQTIEVLVAVDITNTAGVTTSTEAAQALSRTQAAQAKTLGVSTGANTALSLSRTQQAQSKTLTPATGSNAAVGFTKTQQAQTKTVAVAVASNAAQPLDYEIQSADIVVSVAAALEAASARPLSLTQAAQAKTIGVTTETGASQTLAHSQTSQQASLTSVAETGSARPLASSQTSQTTSLGSAVETGSARTLGSTQAALAASIGAATATGTALTLTFTQQPQTRTLGFTVESDLAWTLAGPGAIRRTLVPATETGTSQPLALNQTATSPSLTAAIETSTAVHLGIEGEVFAAGIAGAVNPHSTQGHIESPLTGRLVN